MTTHPHTPEPDTLAHSVVAYFARLPEEELTTKDIALKWDVEVKDVRAKLVRLVQAGLLSMAGSVYSAGPHIARFSLKPDISLSKQKQPSQRGQVANLRDINPEDITALPLVVGTLPRRIAKVGGSKWEPLFARITQPGWLIELPADWKTCVSAEAVKRNRAGKVPVPGHKWVCRRINNTTAGLALEKA